MVTVGSGSSSVWFKSIAVTINHMRLGWVSPVTRAGICILT